MPRADTAASKCRATPDGRITEAEAITRFSRELDEIAARGREPDCAEALAQINAGHEAECARLIEKAEKPVGSSAADEAPAQPDPRCSLGRSTRVEAGQGWVRGPARLGDAG